MLTERNGRKIGAWLLHPLLISGFAILAFYASNLGQVEISSLLRPAIAAILLAGLVLASAKILLPESARAAAAASITLAVFWSYGHIYDGLTLSGILGETVVRHRYLLPIMAAGLAFIFWSVSRADSIRTWTAVLNLVAVALWGQSLLRVAVFEVDTSRQEGLLAPFQSDCALSAQPGERTPDVYLIIMDAYERDDILLEMNNYDNMPFIRALEDRGFYVARGSLSNYRHSEMSIASVLNFDYLQNIPGSYDPTSNIRAGVTALIANSRLRRELECLGYYSVATETGAFWTEWRDARYFLSRKGGSQERVPLFGGLTRTESFLVNTTILRIAVGLGSRLNEPSAIFDDPLADHRDRILFAFEQLQTIPNLPGRKLVFVHILSPHPPMVFGPNGEFVTMATFETDPSQEPNIGELLEAYADQVEFLNKQLLESVDAILANSDVLPIIIIQGDHGWADRNAEDKLSILNAYHLPQGGSARLHPRITPVNSFRHVLNKYFGGQFEILDDVSYFSTEQVVFNFDVIENTWRGGND